jgi:hypothetical protein
MAVVTSKIPYYAPAVIYSCKSFMKLALGLYNLFSLCSKNETLKRIFFRSKGLNVMFEE